jgi:hypothetical protein
MLRETSPFRARRKGADCKTVEAFLVGKKLYIITV